jgi:hypothetical protein
VLIEVPPVLLPRPPEAPVPPLGLPLLEELAPPLVVAVSPPSCICLSPPVDVASPVRFDFPLHATATLITSPTPIANRCIDFSAGECIRSRAVARCRRMQ